MLYAGLNVHDGDVTAWVTDSTRADNFIKPYDEGRIPDSLDYTFTNRQLAEVDIDDHASASTPVIDFRYGFKQDDALMMDMPISEFAPAFRGPGSMRQYIGPLSSQVMYTHGQKTSISWDGGFRWNIEVDDKPVRSHQNWFAGPATPGAFRAPDAAYAQVDPNASQYDVQGVQDGCSLCRRGNLLVPYFDMILPNEGTQTFDGYRASLWDFDYHLYKDGVEIPPGSFLGARVYDLPAEAGSYRLTASGDQNTVEWTFTSAKPTKDTVQPGHFCPATSADLCQPTPAVYASYDLGSTLDTNNTALAGKRHTFTVNAYHSPSREQMPAIAGLKLWASTDDGAVWTPVPTTRNKDGSFTATTTYPSLDRTTGAVSLKVQAWDVAGNTVTQTTTRAFGLRSKSDEHQPIGAR